MTPPLPSSPDILEATRLPALCRGVCLYAGLPLPPATAPGQRFVVRSGNAPPELLVSLLQEGFVEDGIDVGLGADALDAELAGPAKVTVQTNGDACPDADQLCRAVADVGSPVLVFCVERLNEDGRVLGVTWAAVPEEEPPPHERFRAAVRSYEFDNEESSHGS